MKAKSRGMRLLLDRYDNNYSAIARDIGLSRQAVRRWGFNGIPTSRVFQLEKLTNIDARFLVDDPNVALNWLSKNIQDDSLRKK